MEQEVDNGHWGRGMRLVAELRKNVIGIIPVCTCHEFQVIVFCIVYQ